jgi:hypothetical protein
MLQTSVNASITIRDSKGATFTDSVVIEHNAFVCAWEPRALES